MTDLTKRHLSSDTEGKPSTAYDKKLKDIGNSLHAEVVVAEGSGYSARVSLTRPSNTNTYGANDVVGALAAALTFPDMGPSGGRIRIIESSLEIDVTAIPSGMTSFRLYLYGVTPPSALADEATFDLPAGDRASFLGYIDLGSPADLGSTLYVQTEQAKNIKLAGTSLFGYLVTNGSYAASSAAVKVITLHAIAL
jgi:hypothetical protein